MNVALITVIEADKQNIDSSNTHYERLLEQEAIRAFTSWRNNAGRLANIDIYAVCITKNTISNATKRRFEELNVTYIEEYHHETETFDCGFFNKPLGCRYLERTLPHDFFIHIDLDMYVMREPQFEWISSCMVYDRIQRQVERIHVDGSVTETFNTCLMVTERKDRIFSIWWDILRLTDRQYKENPQAFRDAYQNLEYRKIEELAFDMLSKVIRIEHIPNSIFGETYTQLSEMTPEERTNVYFHHYHIYPRLTQYNWIQDIKEWNKYSK